MGKNQSPFSLIVFKNFIQQVVNIPKDQLPRNDHFFQFPPWPAAAQPEKMGVKYFLLLAIPMLAWYSVEHIENTNSDIRMTVGKRTLFATSKPTSLLSKTKQMNDGTLDLVSDYAETFRNRENAQNSDYALAEQRFEERNERYIDEMAAYQKKRALLLKQQALRLEKSGRRNKYPSVRGHRRSRNSKY
jgi:hypothetical protein